MGAHSAFGEQPTKRTRTRGSTASSESSPRPNSRKSRLTSGFEMDRRELKSFESQRPKYATPFRAVEVASAGAGGFFADLERTESEKSTLDGEMPPVENK